jgi:hypothetical protein
MILKEILDKFIKIFGGACYIFVYVYFCEPHAAQHDSKNTLPQTKTMIGRQIQALDKRIDTLVYGLYGLTEDEIKVGEGEK